MNTTKIYFRAFNMDLEVEYKGKQLLNIGGAEKYVKKNIINTAEIKKVVQILENKKLTLLNKKFIEKNKIKTTISSKLIKTK